MRRLHRAVALALVSVAVACSGRSCGQEELPLVTGTDGRSYRVLNKGLYKAFYDASDGKLARIEYDNNGDGRPEQIDHHDGRSRPSLIEVDVNSDGKIDRWEYYDGRDKLIKVAVSEKGTGKPDRWSILDGEGNPLRIEYDSDGDGRAERVDRFADRKLVSVELDTDHNGLLDRWQHWTAGVLEWEDLDTDGDGRADRRLRYDAKGQPRLEVLGADGPRPSGTASSRP